MLCDFVQHSCGEHVHVDEWEEHVAECTDREDRAEPKHDESCFERCAHCEVCGDSVLYGSRCPDHYLTTDREDGSADGRV